MAKLNFFKDIVLLGLVIIILLGGIFRFYNLGWDNGYFFHPDEKNNIIFPAADLKFPYRPTKFTYGSLTIYSYRAVGEILKWQTGNSDFLTPISLTMIGRTMSATLSVLIIFLTYYLFRSLFSSATAILATAFVSLNVGLIQAAHFATTETILALAALFIAFAAILIFESKSILGSYMLAGLTLGLATATKMSALVFTPPFLLAHFFSLTKKNFFQRSRFLLVFFALAAVCFLIAFPYSLLDWKSFVGSFNYERQVAEGTIQVFYTVQFRKTLPYLFQIRHIFPWLLGWPVFIFGVAGAILMVYRSWREKSWQKFFLIFLPAFYFLYFGQIFVKWTRYMVPILPFFCLFAAIFLMEFFRAAEGRAMKSLAILLIGGTLVIQFFYALAFLYIYYHPDTRIQATAWIYKNIAPRSVLLLEPFDVVSLPLPSQGRNSLDYQRTWFNFYGLDDYRDSIQKQSKLEELSYKIQKADYIIISSRRIYANHLRLSSDYPLTARYYRLLFGGKLGFRLIKKISSQPQIFGIVLDDSTAEETFQVFDHPTVLIFQNEKRLDKSQILAKLDFQ